jgi:hypothetical protein
MTQSGHSTRTDERQEADSQCGHRHNRGRLCIQLSKECFGFLQVDRVETFREPTVDERKYITGFGISPLVAQQPSESIGGAQFKHPCSLLPAHVQRPAKTLFHVGQCMTCGASYLTFNPVEFRIANIFFCHLRSFLCVDTHSQGGLEVANASMNLGQLAHEIRALNYRVFGFHNSKALSHESNTVLCSVRRRASFAPTCVGGVLHQCMLELIRRIGRDTTLVDQLGIDELCESGLQGRHRVFRPSVGPTITDGIAAARKGDDRLRFGIEALANNESALPTRRY